MGNPILISLEGNIGAGKSTLIEHLENVLQKEAGWIFLKEPVHIWDTIVDENGKTVLANFYEDPKKYAFAFQIMAFTTRYQELKRIVRENPNCKGIICERSLEADKHIFAKMLHRDGLMDQLMYTIYDKYFQEYEGNFKLDGIIHIDALPETCFERVKERSRNGESTITLEYLQTCHDFHKNWFELANNFDLIICKTQYCFDIFKDIVPEDKLVNIGWRTMDFSISTIEKEYDQYLLVYNDIYFNDIQKIINI